VRSARTLTTLASLAAFPSKSRERNNKVGQERLVLLSPVHYRRASKYEGAPMNTSEAVLRELVDCGVEACFANPGTSEMHLVASFDRVGGLRPILGLFEGVCTGAADGYARMSG